MQEAAGLAFPSASAVSGEHATAAPARRPFRAHPWMSTMVWAVVLFAVTQIWVVQGYQVYGSCMEPNLYTGQRLLGSKVALMQGVQRGDIVVFRPPHKREGAFIKRVVALPGEVIEIRNSRVYVNDRPLREPYLRRAWSYDSPPHRVPADSVFVMGDNRDNSNDSRMWGDLPLENVQAKAWVRYWPLDGVQWIR